MAYVDKILQPDETVRYTGRIHWVIYLPGLFVVLLGVIALLAGSFVVPPPYPQVGGAALIGIGVLQLLGAWFRRWTTELAVTNRRVIFKRGFISRHTIEMNMDKVESVDVDQTILGRMMGYGNIVVRGTGSGLEPMRDIAEPLAFRNHVTAG